MNEFDAVMAEFRETMAEFDRIYADYEREMREYRTAIADTGRAGEHETASSDNVAPSVGAD